MIRGREGYGEVLEFNRPSGICCDDKGLFALADSKNQRVLVYNGTIEFQYAVSIYSNNFSVEIIMNSFSFIRHSWIYVVLYQLQMELIKIVQVM